jgi:hypothetical protein
MAEMAAGSLAAYKILSILAAGARIEDGGVFR